MIDGILVPPAAHFGSRFMAQAKRKTKRKTKKKAKRKIQAYAFIDTNIFLDFYRASEATLAMLEKLEQVRDRIICTYQVEMEFLKNRQNIIRNIASLSNLSIDASFPAVLSDTQLSASVKKAKKDISKKQTKLSNNLIKLLDSPANDRVYKVLEHVFRSESAHVLIRDMDIKNKIKRLARRRFQLGYPPRKAKDTSMGDAVNWEWIIYCASKLRGRFIIVSRDSDFGCEYKDKYFLNDQLKQEFRERVGQKSLLYTQKLSVALSELEVPVTDAERETEAEDIVRISPLELARRYQQNIAKLNAITSQSSFTHPGSAFVNVTLKLQEQQDRLNRLFARIENQHGGLED